MERVGDVMQRSRCRLRHPSLQAPAYTLDARRDAVVVSAQSARHSRDGQLCRDFRRQLVVQWLLGHRTDYSQPGLVQSRRQHLPSDEEVPPDGQAAVVIHVDVKTFKSKRKKM